jgi:hypothetical protein
VFFVVQFRWQELLHAGKMEPGISANKTSLSFSVLACWRGTGWWLLAFSDVLPRRKTEEKCSSTGSTGSFNKRIHLQG